MRSTVSDGNRRVLVLEGINSMSDEMNFMTDRLLGLDGHSKSSEGQRARDAWSSLKFQRANLRYCEQPDVLSQARMDIITGNFHAIVVCDLSDEFQKFVQGVGDLLKVFAKNGGVVAFVSTKGQMVIPVIQHLFDVPWKKSRSGFAWQTFTPSEGADNSKERRAQLFSPHDNKTFTCKGWTAGDVPPEECYFEAVDINDGKGPDKENGGSGCCGVAVRPYGDGSVAYFGDCACKVDTCELIAALCMNHADRYVGKGNKQFLYFSLSLYLSLFYLSSSPTFSLILVKTIPPTSQNLNQHTHPSSPRISHPKKKKKKNISHFVYQTSPPRR